MKLIKKVLLITSFAIFFIASFSSAENFPTLSSKVEFSYDYVNNVFKRKLNSYQLVDQFDMYKIIYSPTDTNVMYNRGDAEIIYYEADIGTEKVKANEIEGFPKEGYYRLCMISETGNIFCNKDTLYISLAVAQNKNKTDLSQYTFDIDTKDENIVIDWNKSNMPNDLNYILYYSDHEDMNINNAEIMKYNKNNIEERYEIKATDIMNILKHFQDSGKEQIFIKLCVKDTAITCSQAWNINVDNSIVLLERKMKAQENELPEYSYKIGEKEVIFSENESGTRTFHFNGESNEVNAIEDVDGKSNYSNKNNILIKKATDLNGKDFLAIFYEWDGTYKYYATEKVEYLDNIIYDEEVEKPDKISYYYKNEGKAYDVTIKISDSIIIEKKEVEIGSFVKESDLTADINKNVSTITKELLYFVVSVVILVMMIFLILGKIKKKIVSQKKMNIGKEIRKITSKYNQKRDGKKYINNILELYKKIKDLGYIASPIFLTNLLVSLKSRGLVIILGGNGIGKTALVENLVKALFGEKYKKHMLKIVIKKSTDSSKKFIGMYDRLNNNYIDPYGLTKFISRAYFDSENPYFLLMDEINTQDIERFFPNIIDIDTILNNGESSFIKVGEISDADKENLKRRKMELVKEYNFLVKEDEGIHYFGYKIPKNLFIIGTANVDKFAEPFSGKILDRSDVIKMSYMGDQNYTEEETQVSKINIDIIREKEIISKDVIDIETLEFINKMKEIWPISKRTEKSICYYQILIKHIEVLNISFSIQQKILPLAFGDDYRNRLQNLIKLCHEYKGRIDLEIAIDNIENMLGEEFINFWKLNS